MAKHKRSIWEDLLNAGRRIRKEVDDLFDSQAGQRRKPAPVPVPAPGRREGYHKK